MKIYEEFAGHLDVDGIQYVYTGCHRDWNPLSGYTPPPGTIWEVSVENLPFVKSGVSTLGGSKQEALDALRDTLIRLRDR